MTTDERIADVLLTWEEGREQGQPVSAEDLCRDCPELLDAVKERIRLLENAGWLKPAVTSPTAPHPGRTVRP